MLKTLVTDDFDGGDRWLQTDDRALLEFAISRVVRRAMLAAVEIEEGARFEGNEDFTVNPGEPEDLTVLCVTFPPGRFREVWVRNDAMARAVNRVGGRWQRVGREEWYTWGEVRGLTLTGRFLRMVSKGPA